MIQEFNNKWFERKDKLKKVFLESHPESYEDVLKALISVVINPEQEDELPCNSAIKTINFGDYDGTLVFVIPNYDVYPSNFWTTFVSYGSCSVCDTLQVISSHADYDDDGELMKPSPEMAEDYLTLALHLLQRMKEV